MIDSYFQALQFCSMTEAKALASVSKSFYEAYKMILRDHRRSQRQRMPHTTTFRSEIMETYGSFRYIKLTYKDYDARGEYIGFQQYYGSTNDSNIPESLELSQIFGDLKVSIHRYFVYTVNKQCLEYHGKYFVDHYYVPPGTMDVEGMVSEAHRSLPLLLHGESITYTLNPTRVIKHRTYEMGRKVGTHRDYDKNGKLRRSVSYLSDHKVERIYNLNGSFVETLKPKPRI